MLDLQITAENLAIPADAEAYIRERAAHLDEFCDTILMCRVIVEGPSGHHRVGDPFHVRLDIEVPGAALAVTRQKAQDLHAAVRQAFAAAERQLEDYVRKQRGQVKIDERPPTARVVRIFADRGYGFIQAVDGHEVYFHQNSVLDPGFEQLEVGSEVRYAEEQGDNGPQASTVVILRE